MIPFPINKKEIIPAVFINRPNRFLVQCRISGIGPVNAHLPNPGRLWELLLPGAVLYLYPDQAVKGIKKPRKTDYTVLAVLRDDRPVFLHTHLTNQAARRLIDHRLIPTLEDAVILRQEVKCGNSRFDFLLQRGKENIYLEVKSCTLFGNGIAMFPDAVTERGRKHLIKLADMSKAGIKTMVLFVVHHPRIDWFMPDYHTDYAFSRTLLNVKDRVTILPAAIEWKADLSLGSSVQPLNIPWDYLKKEIQDKGSYLLIVELNQTIKAEVGRLGEVSFKKGCYIYVGSAMKNLDARIARHKRKTKKIHRHIDVLTGQCDRVTPIPIRSSSSFECELSRSLSACFPQGPKGFGSSDCSCPSHLYMSRENPLHLRSFHELIQKYRMRPPHHGLA